MTYDTEILLQSLSNKFELSVLDLSISLKRHYSNRGFTVYNKNNNYIISWKNPQINNKDYYSGELLQYFNASDLYLKMTNNNNLTVINPRTIKQRLINGYSINEFYGVNNNVIVELYKDIIIELVREFKPVYIHCGVLSLKKLYTDSNIIDNLIFDVLTDSIIEM